MNKAVGRKRKLFGSAIFSLALLSCLAGSEDAAADGTRREVPSALFRSHDAKPAEPLRVYLGMMVLSVPSYFAPANGKYDLLLHFHGGPQLQEENVEKAHLNAIVVSVNLGASSGAYSDVFSPAGQLEKVLARIHEELMKTGRAPGARLGRVALTAWSAGFAAVSGILSQPGASDRVDAVLLADGLHAAYLGYPGNYKIHTASIEKYAAFANRAMRGEKLFALTHSSIPTEGYACVAETTAELLRLTSLSKTSHPVTGPRGMREIYEVDRGDFHVKGFEGTVEKDHIDHIKGMHELVLPYLKARWSRPS